MGESRIEHQQEQVEEIPQQKPKRGFCGKVLLGGVLCLLIVLLIVSIILAFTLYKLKEPRTQLVSATLEGIAPRVSLPDIDIKINATLDLKIQVDNRNRASFKHEGGKSILLYEGKQVGETDIHPGVIPSRGSTTVPCRLTLQLDELASNLTGFLGDLTGGLLTMDTVTRIPGKVTLLGFIKKKIIAKSNCQFSISVPEFKITSQSCKSKAKL